MHNALPTKDNQKRRNYSNVFPICFFCNSENETLNHLLLHCKKLRLFRKYINDFIRIEINDETFVLNELHCLLFNIPQELFPSMYAYVYSIYQISYVNNSGGLIHTLNTTFHRNRDIYLDKNNIT